MSTVTDRERAGLCVGGPFAGKVVHMNPAMYHSGVRFHQMTVSRLLCDGIIDADTTEAVMYRHHTTSFRCGGFGLIEANCLVHESMSNPEADRAAVVAMLTMMLEHGLKRED